MTAVLHLAAASVRCLCVDSEADSVSEGVNSPGEEEINTTFP